MIYKYSEGGEHLIRLNEAILAARNSQQTAEAKAINFNFYWENFEVNVGGVLSDEVFKIA